MDNLPRALEWQVRVLRSQFGPQVDGREAYIDLVLVNVYAGAGATNIWFDDLEITGAIEPEAVAAGPARQPTLATTAGAACGAQSTCRPRRKRSARCRRSSIAAG